jgi:hypothetical protein
VLGARVRVRASAGIPGTAGELGTVIAYVTDDSAIVVEIASSGRRIVCEPEDVQAVESPDSEPAGMVGMTVEWLNGYQSATRQYCAASVTRKVRAILYPAVPEKRSSGGSA